MSSEDKSSADDFWDPLQPSASSAAVEVLVDEWFEEVALPLFESGASENPFHARLDVPRELQLTKRRARWLLSLLDLPSQSSRDFYLREFEALFEIFAHQSTFRALTELALNEASADEILCAFHLKSIWSEFPKFWSIRRKGSRAPIIPGKGDQMLGWTRAVRFAAICGGIPAERIIDEDWYYEWLDVPVGDPTYWCFLEYITIRLQAFSAGALEIPTELRRIDRVAWHGLTDISVDGLILGSAARAGQLVRLEADGSVLRSLATNNDVRSSARV